MPARSWGTSTGSWRSSPRGTSANGQEGFADCGKVELAEHLAHVARLAALLAELRERGC